MMSDPYADWHRLQQRIADEAMLDRLRHEREQEKAREAKARKLAEERERTFLEPVLRRRGPLTVAAARERLRDCPEFLRAEVKHVRRLERQLGLKVVVCAASNDGSASGTDPVVAVPVLSSRFAIATWLHEFGHRANPCSHQRRRTSSGSTVCPSCEVAAWSWARKHVYEGLWHGEQQENLRRGLGSYRSYATPAEKVEMDELINAGPTPFAAQRLRTLERMR